MKYLITLLSSIIILSASAIAAETSALEVSNPWVRQAPPGMQVMGAFLELKNTDKQPVIIVGAHSDQFAMVEIHKTEIENGQARMLHQKQLEILPGQQTNFEPGGLHLMMMQPKSSFEKGTQINITLELKNGDSLSFTAPVKRGNMP